MPEVKMQEINNSLGFTVPPGQIGEFKQFLIKNKSYEEYTENIPRGWQYAGNFQDKDPGSRDGRHRGQRAFPHKNNNRVFSVQQCQEQAERHGHTVIGIQYYGHDCWSGTDLNQAKVHGAYVWGQQHHLGGEWNNQVYYKAS